MKRINNVTPERLKEMLSYDRETGIFVWKAKGRGIRHGKRAGSLDSGYRYIVVDGAAYLAQRLAWLFVYGEWPKNVLRFLNDDTDDCRIDNLKDSDFTKEAKAESDKKYREKNWDRLQQYDRARNFGISLKEYGDMLLAQNGCCAICKQPETATRNGRVKALAVDHDHQTGEVRSLLCVQCNTGLGKFKDDRNLLLSAIKYLDHHKGTDRVAAKLEVVRNG
jgi:hypothetical protein